MSKSRDEFKCKHCGRCCLKYGASLPATEADIERWEAADRGDVLKWVLRHDYCKAATGGDLWLSRTKEVSRCPWLRKRRNKKEYYCTIYEVRPEVCRWYPATREQARADKCKGFISRRIKDYERR